MEYGTLEEATNHTEEEILAREGLTLPMHWLEDHLEACDEAVVVLRGYATGETEEVPITAAVLKAVCAISDVDWWLYSGLMEAGYLGPRQVIPVMPKRIPAVEQINADHHVARMQSPGHGDWNKYRGLCKVSLTPADRLFFCKVIALVCSH